MTCPLTFPEVTLNTPPIPISREPIFVSCLESSSNCFFKPTRMQVTKLSSPVLFLAVTFTTFPGFPSHATRFASRPNSLDSYLSIMCDPSSKTFEYREHRQDSETCSVGISSAFTPTTFEDAAPAPYMYAPGRPTCLATVGMSKKAVPWCLGSRRLGTPPTSIILGLPQRPGAARPHFLRSGQSTTFTSTLSKLFDNDFSSISESLLSSGT
mmetsp:Transcript_14040/g.34254  ORF Transcript_14040/g.34254 Transcript_14040/m.34254 type:complete len:211 (-) Transcript_14040:101-733(-)